MLRLPPRRWVGPPRAAFPRPQGRGRNGDTWPMQSRPLGARGHPKLTSAGGDGHAWEQLPPRCWGAGARVPRAGLGARGGRAYVWATPVSRSERGVRVHVSAASTQASSQVGSPRLCVGGPWRGTWTVPMVLGGTRGSRSACSLDHTGFTGRGLVPAEGRGGGRVPGLRPPTRDARSPHLVLPPGTPRGAVPTPRGPAAGWTSSPRLTWKDVGPFHG